MNRYRVIHRTAIVTLFVLAFMSMLGTVRAPLAVVDQIVQAIIGIALWSLLISKIWKRPRKWGLGVGIFLLAVIAFHAWLLWLAPANPNHGDLGISSTGLEFVLYETPIAVGAVSCLLLRYLPE